MQGNTQPHSRYRPRTSAPSTVQMCVWPVIFTYCMTLRDPLFIRRFTSGQRTNNTMVVYRDIFYADNAHEFLPDESLCF